MLPISNPSVLKEAKRLVKAGKHLLMLNAFSEDVTNVEDVTIVVENVTMVSEGTVLGTEVGRI